MVSHKICVVVFVLARFEDDSKDSGREPEPSSNDDISAASAQRLCMYHTQGTDDSKDSGALKQAAPAAESSKSI